MPDLDLNALAAVAEAATPGPWDISQNWLGLGVPDDSQDLRGEPEGDIGVVYMHYSNKGANGAFISALDPSTVLALITEVRDARAEAIRENAQMLSVQDELHEALDSICEHKAAMTDMKRRKEAAEAELERLRGEVAALADEWEAQSRAVLKRMGHPDAELAPHHHANRLRALIGGGR